MHHLDKDGADRCYLQYHKSIYTVSHCPLTICYTNRCPMSILDMPQSTSYSMAFGKKTIYFLKTIGLRIWSYTYGYLRNKNNKLLLLNYYYYWSWIILYFIFSHDQWRPIPGILRNFFGPPLFASMKMVARPHIFPSPPPSIRTLWPVPLWPDQTFEEICIQFTIIEPCLISEHSIVTTNSLPPLARGFSTTFVCVCLSARHQISTY